MEFHIHVFALHCTGIIVVRFYKEVTVKKETSKLNNLAVCIVSLVVIPVTLLLGLYEFGFMWLAAALSVCYAIFVLYLAICIIIKYRR